MDINELTIRVWNYADNAKIAADRGVNERAYEELRELQQILEKEIGSIAAKDDHPAEKAETPEEPVTEEQPGPETTES